MRAGRVVPIQPKALELLHYLVRQRDRVVSRQELLQKVWPGIAVSPNTLATTLKKVRKSLDDDGATQRAIRTIRGRGVRFALEVRGSAEEPPPRPRRAGSSSGSQRSTHPTPSVETDLPRLIVLPFAFLWNEPDTPALQRGLAEELSLALSRFDLRVIATFSSNQVGTEPAAALDLVSRTGAQFVLSGAVGRDGAKILVTARLSDSRSLEIVWSDRFSADLTGSTVFAAQDKIARAVAGHIAGNHGAVHRALYQEVRRSDAVEFSTYIAVLRFHHNQLTHNPMSLRETRQALVEATQAEPNYALTLAMLAELEADEFGVRGNADPTILALARRRAERAIGLDGTCQQAHWALAYVEYLSRNSDAFRAAADRALELNPNNAYLAGLIGWSRALMGDWKEGIAMLEQSIEVNPYCPGWFYLAPFLEAYRRGHYEEALVAARRVGLAHLPLEWAILIAALHRLGRSDEAHAAASRLDENLDDVGTQLPVYLDALIYDHDLAGQLARDVFDVMETLHA